jgi:hypothetical protein
MKIADLEKLWDEFSHVEIDSNDLTMSDFFHWKIGTKRKNIMEWFNNHLPNGLLLQDFSLLQLEQLLDDFSAIPIKINDEIEVDFYCWEKGTSRFEIWHWFDEKLPEGIHKYVI